MRGKGGVKFRPFGLFTPKRSSGSRILSSRFSSHFWMRLAASSNEVDELLDEGDRTLRFLRRPYPRSESSPHRT